MINYFDGLITDILPPNLASDKRCKALAFALRDLLRMMDNYSKGTLMQGDLSNVPEEALDLMAAELRTQHYYDTGLEREIKEDLIAKTPEWHKKAGTPEAVEELLAVLFGHGKVVEWFEYDGEPYHFKVQIGSTAYPELLARFEKLIVKVKNARSILDNVDVAKEEDIPLHAPCYSYAVRRMPCLYEREVES